MNPKNVFSGAMDNLVVFFYFEENRIDLLWSSAIIWS
jgi:hypothetical protein